MENQPAAAQAEAPTRPRLSREARKIAYTHLLTACVSPRVEHARFFDPDENDGSIRYCSRQEAIDRKWPVYVGRPDTLTKVFRVRGAPFGEWGAIRWTANGLADGQLRLQKALQKVAK